MADRNLEAVTDTGRKAPRRRLFAVVSLLLFAALAVQLAYHAAATSATVDEPNHILAGHRHWQCGDFGINPEHPPLLKLIAAAPLNFRELAEPPWECGSKLTSKFEAFSYGSTFLVDNGIDSVLITTRLAASVMSMLLALLVFLAAWEMFGRWEALTALAIVAFEPNLVGHGSLVTTDMAISATSFAAVYALYRFGKGRTWPRLAVAGLALGLMLSAKHSAVVFVGIIAVLLAVDTLLFRAADVRLGRRAFGNFAALIGIGLISLAILWSFYGFRYGAVPNPSEPPISIAGYIHENGRPEMVDSLPARVTDAVGGMHILPESYVLGMADVISWGSRNMFLFGRNYPTGKWFYFPVAFAVKSNIALLLLLPLGLIFAFVNRGKLRESIYLLLPACVFFVFASSSSFTTGIRHVLPVYGFLIVLAAAGAVWVCRRYSGLRYAVAGLLIFNAAAAVRTAPNYLVFANDLWGGPENTHRIFVDSNTEMGQSMNLVDEYLKSEGVTDCWIAVFVHPEMIRSVQPCRPMPSSVRIMVSRDLIDAVPPVIEGTVVLSARELPPSAGDEYVPIARSAPVAFIGGNTYVYRGRFVVPLAAAVSRTHRSAHFLRIGEVENAMTEAREAVALAPEDPRGHLALGLALAKAGQKEEARGVLTHARELARTDPRFRNQEVRANNELRRLDPN